MSYTENLGFPGSYSEKESLLLTPLGGCYAAAAAAKSLQSNSVRPHRWQPTRLCRPWDSPGKNNGVGCHFLLQCMKVKSESEVTESCPTLSHPMDCSPPGSSIHGIFQARVLEWDAIAFSKIHVNNFKTAMFLSSQNHFGLGLCLCLCNKI